MAKSRISQTLVAHLSSALGPQTAARELKWMRDASPSTSALEQMVERRLKCEPLQYILGTQPFGPLDLIVRPPVLIPRPETEQWTLRLASMIRPSSIKPIRLLDLCTGSGCIPLLLEHLWPAGSVQALGVDVADEAIQLARENAKRTGIPCPRLARLDQNSLSLLQADMLRDQFIAQLKQSGWLPFDMITSNPPYIPLSEYNELSPSVRNYEDARALLGDPKSDSNDGRGLTFYRAIADLVRRMNEDGSPELVKAGGLIALEVGHDQSVEVRNLMETHAHVQKTEVWKDPWGVERVVVCWK